MSVNSWHAVINSQVKRTLYGIGMHSINMDSISVHDMVVSDQGFSSMDMSVPHSGSGVAPMSSLSGVELLGFCEFGMGGLMGEGRGK